METLRQQILRRHEALCNERAPWLAHWQELSKLILPASGRFMAGEHKPAQFNAIYDNTATRAMRTLAAGLMSGILSLLLFKRTIGFCGDSRSSFSSLLIWQSFSASPTVATRSAKGLSRLCFNTLKR